MRAKMPPQDPERRISVGGLKNLSKLDIALLIAAFLNAYLSLKPFYETSYDAWEHMFFASHYMREWFSLFEPRWFGGGFLVSSYPPLTHQFVALLGYLVGLIPAYLFVSLIAMILFPVAVFAFSRCFVSEEHAGIAAILAVFLPAMLHATYAYGQLTTVVSTVLGLFGAACSWRYLQKGSLTLLALSATLLVSSFAAHHVTATIFLPPTLLCVAWRAICVTKDFRLVAKRGGLLLLVTGVVLGVVLYPFWEFTFKEFQEQAPVFHMSKLNYFKSPVVFKESFVIQYLYFLPLLPIIVFYTLMRRQHLLLLVMALLFFVLGFGGTTPLPRILFGKLWEQLTYERFALASGIFFLPLLAMGIADFISPPFKNRMVALLVLGLFALLLLNYGLRNNLLRAYLPEPFDLNPTLEFLDKHNNRNWRYLTLDFGTAMMQKLNTLSDVQTVDGFYFTARGLPVLTNSGLNPLDAARFYPSGVEVLQEVLQQADELSLKLVFTNSNSYDSLLEDAGFQQASRVDATLSDRLGSVYLWIKSDTPPIQPSIRLEPKGKAIIWGVGPLASFTLALVLGLLNTFGLLRIRSVPHPKSLVLSKGVPLAGDLSQSNTTLQAEEKNNV